MVLETLNLLLKKDDGIVGTYYIYCKSNNMLIGSITYRGYHFDSKLGDIGFFIHQMYTNKGYGKEALFRLIELLNDNGIDDFWITCEFNNEVSKHIINKYLDIEKVWELDDVLKFQCSVNLDKTFTTKKK